MGRSQPETVCALQRVALRPVPVPSSALLARLAPLTPVPGRPDLVAHHAPDVFALWQAWEEECGVPQAVPFWATVWPAGQLLARVVQAEPAWVRGQTVLDLGCGSGVAGIAALSAGAARVMAHDIDPVALAIAAQNARANAVELLLQGTPCSTRPAPRVSPVSSSGTSSMSAPRRRPCGRGCARPTGRGSRSSSRTRPGRLPPRPVCGVCGRNAWPPPGPGRARMPGRCDSSRRTPETALRQRPSRACP
jgi:Ribosomal protein L11 methyltransferase (PrmA)